VVPAVLAILAATFGYAALQDRSAMVEVPVASGPIPAGSVVDAADTHMVRVHASDQVLTGGLLGPSQLDKGWTAAVRIGTGQPVTLSEVAKPTGAKLGAMSIEVPVEHAAGGTISPGDLVDVIAANGSGGAYYVAQGLRVLSVASSSASAGVLGGGGQSYFIVVSVDKRTALRIAAAMGAGSLGGGPSNIEVVRSTGEAASRELTYQMRGE
jgi:Flp pilus assembly protein CpaB